MSFTSFCRRTRTNAFSSVLYFSWFLKLPLIFTQTHCWESDSSSSWSVNALTTQKSSAALLNFQQRTDHNVVVQIVFIYRNISNTVLIQDHGKHVTSKNFSEYSHVSKYCGFFYLYVSLKTISSGISYEYRFFDISPLPFSTNNDKIGFISLYRPSFLIVNVHVSQGIDLENITYYMTIPREVQSKNVDIIARIVGVPTWAKTLIGCYTCDKSKLLNTIDIEQLSLTIVFADDPVHISCHEANTKLNNFGNHESANAFMEYSPSVQCLEQMAKYKGNQFTFEDCILHTFLNWQNTFQIFHWSLRQILRFKNPSVSPSTFSTSFYPRSKHYIPFGVQFDGIKYAVVLGINEKFDIREENSIHSAIFSSFSVRTWVLLVASLIGGSFILHSNGKAGVFKSVFWSVSILLEQGDSNQRGIRVCNNYIIIVCWTFSVLLIKNLYSSNLCSLMTKVPGPSSVPDTIQELFFGEPANINIIADYQIITDMYKKLKLWYRVKNPYFNDTDAENFAANYFFRVQSPPPNFNFDSLSTYVANVILGKSIKCQANLIRSYLQDARYSFNDSCSTFERFSVLYKSGKQLHTALKQRYLLLMYDVFGKRPTVRNINDPLFLPDPILWTVKKQYFFDRFQFYIASLVETGIMAKLESNLDLSIQNSYFGDASVKLSREIRIETINIFTFNDLHASKPVENGAGESDVAWIKYEHISVVMVVYMYGLALSSLFVVFEILNKCLAGDA